MVFQPVPMGASAPRPCLGLVLQRNPTLPCPVFKARLLTPLRASCTHHTISCPGVLLIPSLPPCTVTTLVVWPMPKYSAVLTPAVAMQDAFSDYPLSPLQTLVYGYTHLTAL